MSNDLISRAWLKKHKFTTQVCNGLEIEYVDVVCVATIDNAPTVEQSYQMPKDYIKNKLDYSRPQGEWIIDGHHYKCSRCGKTLAIMFSETDDDDLIGCPFCLADMRVKRKTTNNKLF